MVLPACGVEEPTGGLDEVFDVREAELVSAVSRGCVFELTSVVRAGTLPPIHDIFLSRLASGTCAWPAASIGLGTSINSTPSLSLVANDLGVVAGFTVKNGYSGSSPRTVGIKHVDPELLTVVRNTGFAVYLGTGSVFLGYLAIGADGTTLTAGGTKAGIISPTETGSGSNFIATFPDFFTSTTPPSVVAY